MGSPELWIWVHEWVLNKLGPHTGRSSTALGPPSRTSAETQGLGGHHQTEWLVFQPKKDKALSLRTAQHHLMTVAQVLGMH